ncbi:hypothetical protein ABG79_02273 [Caloramator mitchellensis]|uniref:DUF2232 domain-containing protein n=1 Tax=Caloramator mitchellensis TaxID=908809 RepID=A0A0R3JR89_CALMK|nr:YybS family protein [Caloramator mitchellensis]KRQ85969.1 hypothetical protein ABG79_02273 [Caloramator mitchellensis]
MQKTSTKSLIESSLLTAIAVVLILISIYIPVFYYIGLFMWPLPLALVQIKHGYKYSITSLVATTIIILLFTDPYTAFGFAITNGLLGIALGYMIKKRANVFTMIFVMVIINIISLTASIKLFGLIAGQDYIKMAFEELYRSLDTAKNMYSKMGIPKETTEAIFKSIPPRETMMMLIPTALIFHGILSSVITYFFAKKIYSRFGIKLEDIPKFSNWYIPAKFALTLMLLILLGYLAAYMRLNRGEAILLNAMYLMMFVFTINGLAALSFYLEKRGLAKSLRLLIMFFVFTSFGNLLFIVGIIDYSLNLRKLDISRLKDSPK